MRDYKPLPGIRYWAASYTREGAQYAITFPAATADDALKALQEVYADVQIDGEAMGHIPA